MMATTHSWTSRVWASVLSLFGVRGIPSAVALPRAAEPQLIPLRQLVQVRGARPRSAHTFPVMLEAVSERGFLFKTQNTTIKEGEALTFDALLRGVGALKLSGKVEWLLQGSVGYSGEIRLDSEESEARAAWLRYVEFQGQGVRGATV